MICDIVLEQDYTLTWDKLRLALLIAHYCARQHKANKPYVGDFEEKLDQNLDELCDDLFNRRYKARPSTRFLVYFPKMREIYAADYRDRIVHHLIYNITHRLFERTFIYDTYSCIEGRGTHFGIERFSKQIRQCTHNYQQDAYILSMDIRGYFMHIDRQLLYDITRDSLFSMADHEAAPGIRYRQIIDINFLLYVLHEVIMLDPTVDCITIGDESEFDLLPESKRLRPGSGIGLPIGNLTSQLLSNVFLNVLDQFVKRVLKCRYYGRYVDDFHLIDPSRDYLHDCVPQIVRLLDNELDLEVNQGKTHIVSARHGAEFLGAFIKPHRTYISSQSLRRMNNRINSDFSRKTDEGKFSSLNSTLGTLSHYSSYNIRRELTDLYYPDFCKFAHCDSNRGKLIRNE